MYEKFGIATENRTFLDKFIVNFLVGHIIYLAPSGILMVHRNLIGPFDNLNMVKGLYSIVLFGRISTSLMFLQTILVWYITEKVLEQFQYDPSDGIVECSQFFTGDFPAE